MRTAPVLLLALVLVGCPSPSTGGGDAGPDDAGADGGGGGLDGGGTLPGATFASDDGLAVLFVPTASGQSAQPITVRRADGGFDAPPGYVFEPSGLTFSPPALLVFASGLGTVADAGVPVLTGVTLERADGTTEALSSASYFSGSGPALTTVQVPHFSRLKTEVQGMYLYTKTSHPDFERVANALWGEEVTLSVTVYAHRAVKLSPYMTAPGTTDINFTAMPGIVLEDTEIAGGERKTFNFKLPCTRPTTEWVARFSQLQSDGWQAPKLGVHFTVRCYANGYAQADATRTAVAPKNGSAARMIASVEGLEYDLDKALETLFPTLPLDVGLKTLLQCRRCALDVDRQGALEVTNNEGSTVTAPLVDFLATGRDKDPVGFARGDGSAYYSIERKFAGVVSPAGRSLVQVIYKCRSKGKARINVVYSPITRNHPCLFGPYPWSSSPEEEVLCDADLDGDALLLADSRRVTRAGAGFSFAAAGVAANLIHAAPSTRAGFTQTSSRNLVYTGVPAWQSNPGLSPITLKTSLQSATATFNGTAYAFSGLTAGPAFAASDALRVEAQVPDGGVYTFTVPAPPPLTTPAAVLGPPAGLKTEVRFPDGSFELAYVSLSATGPGGGSHGLMRFLPADQLPLVGTDRVFTLLDDDAIAALSSRGLTATTIYFAALNERFSDVPFALQTRTLPVQAGRMFYVQAADLTP